MYLLIVYIQKSSGAVIRGLLSVINVGSDCQVEGTRPCSRSLRGILSHGALGWSTSRAVQAGRS